MENAIASLSICITWCIHILTGSHQWNRYISLQIILQDEYLRVRTTVGNFLYHLRCKPGLGQYLWRHLTFKSLAKNGTKRSNHDEYRHKQLSFSADTPVFHEHHRWCRPLSAYWYRCYLWTKYRYGFSIYVHSTDGASADTLMAWSAQWSVNWSGYHNRIVVVLLFE